MLGLKNPIFVLIFVCDYLSVGVFGVITYIHITAILILKQKCKQYLFDAKYEYESEVLLNRKLLLGQNILQSRIKLIQLETFCRRRVFKEFIFKAKSFLHFKLI